LLANLAELRRAASANYRIALKLRPQLAQKNFFIAREIARGKNVRTFTTGTCKNFRAELRLVLLHETRAWI
jgi:hypothetical protein